MFPASAPLSWGQIRVRVHGIGNQRLGEVKLVFQNFEGTFRADQKGRCGRMQTKWTGVACDWTVEDWSFLATWVMLLERLLVGNSGENEPESA